MVIEDCGGSRGSRGSRGIVQFFFQFVVIVVAVVLVLVMVSCVPVPVRPSVGRSMLMSVRGEVVLLFLLLVAAEETICSCRSSS